MNLHDTCPRYLSHSDLIFYRKLRPRKFPRPPSGLILGPTVKALQPAGLPQRPPCSPPENRGAGLQALDHEAVAVCLPSPTADSPGPRL